MTEPVANRWSSRLAFYLVTVGAAVGLGSIWRFPYLAGTSGGFAFIFVFLIACAAIATPLLVAEFLIGRWSRRSPAQAAGEIAARFGGSRAWNFIGWAGTVACFLIFTYYPMIAGWVLAYTWKFATGQFVGLPPGEVGARFAQFLSSPLEMWSWHAAFLAMVAVISARGLQAGIEATNRIRAPALLLILLGLVAFALTTGDVARGLRFAFAPDFSKLTPQVVLAAIGQAFYAVGVGVALMMAYGAYVKHDVSLLRSAIIVNASVIVVSMLASLMIFPLVFAYGMDPAGGPQLVFDVLPRAFALMPLGRLVGTVFFVLLVLGALTPSIAALEPAVAWLIDRFALSRGRAVAAVSLVSWLLGLGSVLSFNVWANWFPFDYIPWLAGKNVWTSVDFVAANVLTPLGAIATSVFIGWRMARYVPAEELAAMSPLGVRVVFFLLKWLCPVAIAIVMLTALK